VESMAGWAGAGTVSSFGLSGKSVNAKLITGPVSGWYHITQTASLAGYVLDYDVYSRLTPTTDPTAVDLYGALNIDYTSGSSTYSYDLTFGSSADPFHGAVTRSLSTITSILIDGTVVMAATGPSGDGAGTNSLTLTVNYSNISMPVTAGLDYPSGTVTVGIVYNGATQPDFVIVFDGTAVADWTFGGSSGTINVSAASIH
jgi:hypothetical protein